MKLITRDTDYALRALCYISRQNGRIVSVSELTRQLRVPRPFLRKILQILNKKKMLESFKGQGGGFLAAREPGKIFLADLMRIFQGRLSLNECFLGKLVCPNKNNCLLRKKIVKIEGRVLKELGSITIASLLK